MCKIIQNCDRDPINCEVLQREWGYNRFKSRDNVLEFIAMFEAGYPNFNIRKNGRR